MSSHRGGEAAGAADATSGRPLDATGGAPEGTTKSGGGHDQPLQKPYSFSMGAIPTEMGPRDKKRSHARFSLPAGYSEASYRSEESAYDRSGQPTPQQYQQAPDTLPRPYPMESRSFGYAPKEISRSMGTTTLPREIPSGGGYVMEGPLAKGDTGRPVRLDYRTPVPHGLSRSLPKQSYFPAEEGERLYYPSRSALCLQDLPEKQHFAEEYYASMRKLDPGARLSSSSAFKPKHGDRREESHYVPYSMMSAMAYDEAEYRKQWAAAYTGDQRWLYDNRYQPLHHQYQQYMVQETTRNDVFREAGDTVVVKSSGDTAGGGVKYTPSQQAANDMFVYVRDAQTSTDTPVPVEDARTEGESPPSAAAAEMPLMGEAATDKKEDDTSSASSSSDDEDDEEESSSSESSSSGASTPAQKAGDDDPAAVALLPPEEMQQQQQMLAHRLQQEQQQIMMMQMTPQDYAEYQDAMRTYEVYYHQQQPQAMHPLYHQQAYQQQVAMQQQQLLQLQRQHQQQLLQQQQLMQQQGQLDANQLQQRQSLHSQQSQQQMMQPAQQQMMQPSQQLLKQRSQLQLQQRSQPQVQQQSQQQLQQQSQQQMQQQSQQQLQQQALHQQQLDPNSGQQERKVVYFAANNAEGGGEATIRMPGEGSSIRSFQSRTSGDAGAMDSIIDDSRSLMSSNTNMGTPLLRPLLPERAANAPTKNKMEHFCLAVNVILFSVLAGVVAAFIVQQVTHAI